MKNHDLMEAVGKRNPVLTIELSENESVRAEALLARTMALPRNEQASPVTSRLRRGLRIAAIAGVASMGMAGVAWAVDVTPASIDAGIRIINTVDVGTVSYAGQQGRDADTVLEELVQAAKNSGTLGDGDTSLLVTKYCGDAWPNGQDEPDRTCVEDQMWALPDGNTRMNRVPDSSGGYGWFEEWAPLAAGDNHDASPPHGLSLILGPTVADTISTLAPIAYLDGAWTEGGEVQTWQLVEAYMDAYLTGVGISGENRAAFLEALRAGDYTYGGFATDSLGRTGEVFATAHRRPGYTEETRLVIDPSNGSILARESVMQGPWFIRGSQNRVEGSATYLSYGLVPTPPACVDVEGCEVVQIG